ncbi:hypothetical protein HS041_11060 [Planomonospora sp. ID67723]|uniref:hypothetical protein n=1 Tax=Planomonospora sp. ID67723 TaxID=2738134 RepID=UPI0018C36D50|nr:hypothetical protein [Planomonospora sp. ID67723]MBG0828303.1 hypothetical protein [Planomonospora sp. ID67723]
MALVRGDSPNSNEAVPPGADVPGTRRRGAHRKVDRGSGVIGRSTSRIGAYGENAEFEGVRGTSRHKDRAGIVGTNEAGGAAVYGDGAVGVQGIGKQWIGVYGETQAAPSVGAAGVWGEGKNGGDGVKGHASASGKAGVAGVHLTGKGPGVYGEGSPAGFFKGVVEVTGGIVSAGVDVTFRIHALEREVARLLTRVAALESYAGGSGGGSPAIDAELALTGGPFSALRVFGCGFDPGEPVEITVESVSSPAGPATSSRAQTEADADGRIDHTVGVLCPAGLRTTHSARVRGAASGRISNVAGRSC